MTPTNEQVVAACQRAGIPVGITVTGELSIAFTGNAYLVYQDNDTRPGSALFIVAVLGALDKADVIRGDKGRWRVGGRLTTCETMRIVARKPKRGLPSGRGNRH